MHRHSVLNAKCKSASTVGALNQEKALVGAFSMIVKSLRRFISSSLSRATLGHWGNCDITPPPHSPSKPGCLGENPWPGFPQRRYYLLLRKRQLVTNGDTQFTVPHSPIRDPCTEQWQVDRWYDSCIRFAPSPCWFPLFFSWGAF